MFLLVVSTMFKNHGCHKNFAPLRLYQYLRKCSSRYLRALHLSEHFFREWCYQLQHGLPHLLAPGIYIWNAILENYMDKLQYLASFLLHARWRIQSFSHWLLINTRVSVGSLSGRFSLKIHLWGLFVSRQSHSYTMLGSSQLQGTPSKFFTMSAPL